MRHSFTEKPVITMQQSYVRVLVLWVIVLTALFAFQEYFS